MKAFFRSILSTTIGVVVGSFVSLFLLILMVAILMKVAQYGGAEPIVKNSILHLRLHGQLVDKHRPLDFDIFGENSFLTDDHTIGLFELNRAIDLAKDDSRISGMYIEFRDFDAGWANATSLRRRINEFAQSGKFVYAYADRYDELSYFLATAGNQVFIEPFGDIELNGFAVNEAFIKGLFEKLDVEPKIFRAGKFKAAVEPLILEKMSPENREQTQALVDDLWKVFRTETANSMKLEENRIDEIAAGLQATSAEQALKLGLVHETLFADQVEDRMRSFTVGEEKELELVTPGRLLRDRGPKAFASKSGKKIALIFAEGEIVSGPGGIDNIGAQEIRQDIVDARMDGDVAAIVLRINSPGGDALASDVIWRELAVTDEEVPVVVSMGDLAASGGYYISSAGRFIFAEPTTITGSIGVFGILLNTEKFFRNKAGIKFDRVVTHPHADIGFPNKELSPLESEVIQRDVDRVYKRFLDVVQEGRGFDKRSDVESLAEGRVWSGARAKTLGLVDDLGSLDQAVAKAAEIANLTDYEIDVYPKFQEPLLELLERFSGDAASGALSRMGLGGLPEAVKNLPPAAKMKSGVYTRLPVDLHIR